MKEKGNFLPNLGGGGETKNHMDFAGFRLGELPVNLRELNPA